MMKLRKISEETLAKASVLTHQQMSKVVGGMPASCSASCPGKADVSVNCSGCTAVDGMGVTCGDGTTKLCRTQPSASTEK